MTISIKEVLRYFDNPGRAWETAFSSLGQAERALLLAVLDSGGAVETERLKEMYEERAHEISGALPFDKCLRRVTHSFLSLANSWDGRPEVDFQHPSVRDMLLHQLADNGPERKQYIRWASAVSVAAMIQALSNPAGDQSPSRFNLAVSETEVDSLVKRLDELTISPMESSDWRAILQATLSVAPVSAKKEHLKQIDLWLELRGVGPGRQLTSPGDMDLGDFAGSTRGKILAFVAKRFSSHLTWENNRSYQVDMWRGLLRIFYSCASYVRPLLYPQYVGDYLELLGGLNVEDRIATVSELMRVEPLAVRQMISQRELEKWADELEANIASLIDQGHDVDDRASEIEDSPEDLSLIYDDYAAWQGAVDDVLSLGDFYEWSGCERPAIWNELSRLFDRVIVEDRGTRDDDYDRDRYDRPMGPYWTIETMFADL